MKKFKITYFMYPEENIEVTIMAKDMEEAIIYAKDYRQGSFSVDEIAVESAESLKARRERLVKQNQKEYATRGNTQRCQELWAEIEEIDAMLKEVQ